MHQIITHWCVTIYANTSILAKSFVKIQKPGFFEKIGLLNSLRFNPISHRRDFTIYR